MGIKTKRIETKQQRVLQRFQFILRMENVSIILCASNEHGAQYLTMHIYLYIIDSVFCSISDPVNWKNDDYASWQRWASISKRSYDNKTLFHLNKIWHFPTLFIQLITSFVSNFLCEASNLGRCVTYVVYHDANEFSIKRKMIIIV